MASFEIPEQIKIEYDTLRKEIEAAKVWEVRLLVGGLIGFPAAFEWVQKTSSSELSFLPWLLPVGVIVLSFLVGFIRWSAMRCGRYICDVLEPHFPLDGWESWRGKSEIRRGPERLLAAAFLIVLILYYGVAVTIGLIHLESDLAKTNLGSVYVVVLTGVAAALYLAGLLVTIAFAWTPTSAHEDHNPILIVTNLFKKVTRRR
jgi:hypothetical protein